MSHFDKALERARSAPPEDDKKSFDVMLPEEAPALEMFDTPWDVSERPAAHVPPEPGAGVSRQPVPAAMPAPATRPLEIHRELAEKVVVDERTSAVVIEQYRKLAGSLHQWQIDHGGKVVMVVSAVSSEGKTLTALNLALTLSASYQRRVLLVDCDLRHPMLHEALQAPAEPGIADTAARGVANRPVVVAPLVDFMPAGGAVDDPVKALTSAGVIGAIEQARANYDWVVLDTPPSAVVPDATLLTDQVDGAVLVVAAGRTSFELVTKAVEAVGRDRILGVVLNGVDPRDLTAASYQYYMQR